MGLQLNTLLKDIERCRKEMVQIASHSSLSDDQVIEISTKLDFLLNKYNRIVSFKNK
jgi:hypothetical protein